MLIGLDFDNTIVCYDRLFHRLAVERGLVPAHLAVTKQSVRDYLRAAGCEGDWTELQGIAYGPRIAEAEPFPGVMDFLRRCREADVGVAIVSHKTRFPYRGERSDLHAATHGFLERQGFYRTSHTGLSRERVFLELTLADKLRRIRTLECTAFVDDLPEVFGEAEFPHGVQKVLFDPPGRHITQRGIAQVRSWEECGDWLLAEREALT